MRKPSEGYEFNCGDLVVEIGYLPKWRVWAFGNNRYRLQSISGDTHNEPNVFSIEKEECEANYVKVGAWDNKKWDEEGDDD